MDEIKIPFNRPVTVGREMEYMGQAIANGKLAGDGPFTLKCNQLLEEALQAQKVLLTTSCTHALELAGLLLEIGPEDEVIVPSFTFTSSAGAFALRGAKIVFADIRPDTLNIDETRLENLITPRTKAICVVHYAGVGCEMNAIGEIARRHNLAIIEDNAHGLFATYQGRPLGSFGVMSTLSFHETKNFSCGEGGALIINDPALVERAEIIREKGTNRSRYFRGQVDKYSWVDIGSSYLPSDLLAAFLYAQLERRDYITQRRREVWEFYHSYLQGWAKESGAQLPTVPADCQHPYHLYYILMPSLEQRQNFIKYMRSQGIGTAFHYVSLHLSEMGRKYGYDIGACPVTEDVSDRLVRLPLFNELTEQELVEVVRAVKNFKG